MKKKENSVNFTERCEINKGIEGGFYRLCKLWLVFNSVKINELKVKYRINP